MHGFVLGESLVCTTVVCTAAQMRYFVVAWIDRTEARLLAARPAHQPSLNYKIKQAKQATIDLQHQCLDGAAVA